ncbi:MAG: hypothetical protein ABI723_24685 [Bacteroidia bacterium]
MITYIKGINQSLILTSNKVDIQKTRLDWWNNKRFKFNKGLAIAALSSILISILEFYFFDYSLESFKEDTSFFLIALVVYSAVLNLTLIIAELTDRIINKDNNGKIKSRLFNWFYWISSVLPFLYPVFIVVVYFC